MERKAAGRKWGLAVAGLAITAVAGYSATGMHTAASPSPHAHSTPAVTAQATQQAVQQARVAPVSGQSAFRSWWAAGGYRQYQAVAADLSALIITDTLQDTTDDAAFYADARRLAADATAASRDLPPVDAAGYQAGMTALAQTGRASTADTYDKAYLQIKAGLPDLAAFNTAISGWDTTAPATTTATTPTAA
jgi:hypothetical protein